MGFKTGPILKALGGLVFPNLCLLCERQTPVVSNGFCMKCLCTLPLSGMENLEVNVFTRQFRNRQILERGIAMCYLSKGSSLSHLIHRMKYGNRPDLALALGRFFGQILCEKQCLNDLDAILPVPLHPRKQKIRGYNQSERIATGLAEVMKKPVREDVLFRNVFTETQTRKNRMERLMNMENAFVVKATESWNGKHILLVDDVLTTGSTLDGCARVLRTIPSIRISMLTLVMGL